MTYQWYRSSLPISGANTSQLLVRDTGSYYVVGTVSGCAFQSSGVFFKRTVVGPILLTSASGAANQVVCRNSPIVPIVYTTNGITSATFVGLPLALPVVLSMVKLQFKVLHQSMVFSLTKFATNQFVH